MLKIILLTDFTEQYAHNLLKGITRYSKDHGPWQFCRMPLFYRESIGIDGILNWARDAGIAVIAQDFKERFTNIPNISGAYHDAGRMGADYFLKKGFKNFAFYGFKNIVWSRERAEGFEEKIAKAGFQVHYFEHKKSRSRDLWYYKPSSLCKWLKNLPKPIALMACDDNQGHHITEACRITGIRIPEDVAVLGVDNDEMLCNLSDPPLSSVALDTEKGGYETARLMEKLVNNGFDSYHDVVVKPTQVITRHSTDIYATNDNYIAHALKYIHQNIEKNLSVSQVLEQVPLSRRSLEKRFMQITGYPVYEYIYNLRIEKFTKKLLETDQTIFEIALDLGLNDSKNIARQFKQVKGCTPMEYRKKYLIGK